MSGDAVHMPQTFDAGVCWGAFAVIQKMTRWADSGGKRYFGVCNPANSTRTQLIAIFVEYAKHHPQKYSDDFDDVVLDGLREAFPCGKPSD